MKHLYPLLLAGLWLSSLSGQAQNWRPFRPNGDVHAFRGASADTVLTLRLDSAAVNSTDSVYYFNRIMRRSDNAAQGAAWRKSLNNQFGTQMRYNVAQRTYVLYWNGGQVNGDLLDRTLVLKPFVPVGTTWSSYFTDYGVTTKLLSRGTSQIDGVQDSVATFQVSNGQVVVLSKNYGLVSAPQNLAFGLPSSKMLTLARRPAAAARSYYDPLAILDLQPGDELGYIWQPFVSLSPFSCFTEWTLRRVMSRTITADSVIYTFKEQRKLTYSGAPGCSGSGTTISPVSTTRAAASRLTGRWRSGRNYSMLPTNTDLLAYAYRSQAAGATTFATVTMGLPVVANRPGSTCGGEARLKQAELYESSNGAFNPDPGIDIFGWQQLVTTGAGVAYQTDHSLIYLQQRVNNAVQTCGSAAPFATLLPVRTARHLVPLQLYPNPARTTATLTLPVPARAAATVDLLDGLGRAVRTQPLTAGQTTVTLVLQGLAAGLYVLEVRTPGEATQRARLQIQE
jgi:hypothetical protein